MQDTMAAATSYSEIERILITFVVIRPLTPQALYLVYSIGYDGDLSCGIK